MKRIIKDILIRKTFRKYRNTLPEKSDLIDPKMRYHAMADSIFWEDEGLTKCHPDLENVFRFVISYRTSLINKETHIDITEKRYFELAKKYFPKWIGFENSRCSYNSESSERLKRIRKVSEWKIDKLMKASSDDFE